MNCDLLRGDQNDKKLFFEAILKYFSGVVLLGLLLFLPAGALSYWNAWLLMGIILIPMLFAGILMMFRNPDLLRKRLNAKEKESEQSLVIKLSGLMFLLGFVNSRAEFPLSVAHATQFGFLDGGGAFLLSYVLFGEDLRQNTYLSCTIEVQENQKVIDTGLYGIVRHPMYSATIVLFLSMPLVLGSLLSFVIFYISRPRLEAGSVSSVFISIISA